MYTPQTFSNLSGITGLSESLIAAHLTLYEGYVKNVNALITLKTELPHGTPAFAETVRRFGWEFDGMRLHELYFAGLIAGGRDAENSPLMKKIDEDFGGFEKWVAEFKAIAAMRGIGWVVLYFDPQAGRLMNAWISEHDAGHLAGCTPIIVLDVFEHAYIADYGLKKVDYIDACVSAFNWGTAAERFSA